MTSRLNWALVALAGFAVLALFVPLAFGATHAAKKSLPGDIANGRKVFVKFCGKCHQMHAAGSKGTIGPNLDQDTNQVDYARVVTAVREGIGGIQAEYTFGKSCSPTDSRCLTWDQLHDVAKFVVTMRPGGVGKTYT